MVEERKDSLTLYIAYLGTFIYPGIRTSEKAERIRHIDKITTNLGRLPLRVASLGMLQLFLLAPFNSCLTTFI